MRKLIILFICVFCVCGIGFAGTAYADTITLDNTNIITDLQQFSVNAQDININDYEFDDSKNLEIINFVEFAYAYRINKQENFNIYVYIYNPKNLNISNNSVLNKLQMSVNGNDYNKYSLRYCSDLNNLIYKFRLLNATDLLDILNDDITADRVYDVSGIELLIDDNSNATEFDVAKTFEYSGFASGYGEDLEAESSLFLNVFDLETIPLTVYHTNYRTGMSNLGENYQNDLSSVYFSIPQYYIDNYGGVYEIMAEWFEYRLNPVLITAKEEIYNNINSVSLYGEFTEMGMGSGVYDWSYNGNLSAIVTADRIFNKIGLKYLVDNYNSEISKNQLTNSINSSNLNDLVIDSAMPFDRVEGYNKVSINNDNYSFDLLNYSDTRSKWQQFMEFGFLAPEQTASLTGVEPIYNVKASDLNSTLSDSLLINDSDVSAFQTFASSEISAGNSVYLFRFANVPYWSDEINRYSLNGNIKVGGGYLWQENIFLDFDIIQLTFFKNDVYSILPVVSSPQDIINAGTPPQEESPWLPDLGIDIAEMIKKMLNDLFSDIGDLFKNFFADLFSGAASFFSILKIIGAIIMGVILLVILSFIIKWIIKPLVWLIRLPFRIIGTIVKGIKRATRKQRSNKNAG